MNCISCGALIESEQKRCPYCNAINPEYERKTFIRRGLAKQRQEAEVETRKTFKTIWGDKLCNICLIASISLLGLSIVAILVGIILVGGIMNWRVTSNMSHHKQMMDEYFAEGEYGKLNAYMDRYDLFDYEKNYRNGQAALMHSFMVDFRVNVYPYVEYLSEGKAKPQYAKSSWTILYDAQKVLCWKLSVYPDIHPDNQQLYDSYRQEIKDILVTYFSLTEEEFEDCYEDGKFYKNEYEDILLERNDFLDE